MTDQEIEFSVGDKDTVGKTATKLSFIHTMIEHNDELTEEDQALLIQTAQAALHDDLDADPDEDYIGA